MIAGPDDPNGRTGSPPARSNSETLSYVMDIIAELKNLANTSGYRNLGAILDVALAEARLQSEDAER